LPEEPGFPPEINLREDKKIKKICLSGNNPLMSFRHLRMLNSASKCLKITLKVIFNFQNQKQNFPKNSILRLGYPP
jgi:hypothetical protein